MDDEQQPPGPAAGPGPASGPPPEGESVWDYPRPPRLERCALPVRVEHGGRVVAQSAQAWRVLETSHPPVYYVPREDVATELLVPLAVTSFCEWKGQAVYFDVAVPGAERARRAAWSYPRPTAAFAGLRDAVAFYAQRLDACFVGEEQVTPQPGLFYGGWITAGLRGPFKGEPGSEGW